MDGVEAEIFTLVILRSTAFTIRRRMSNFGCHGHASTLFEVSRCWARGRGTLGHLHSRDSDNCRQNVNQDDNEGVFRFQLTAT